VPPPTELPLVERINALALEEFVKKYMPQEAPASKISINPKPTNGDGKDCGDPHNEGKQSVFSLEIHTASSMPKPAFDCCLDLIELTSSAAYKHSAVGWSRMKKRKEMKLLDMRYILVCREDQLKGKEKHEDDSNVEGFLSFMVTYENGIEVIYCYEIHLAPSIQKQGIGKRLIHLYEEIGRNVGVEKAMLTVFRSNKISMRFYEKLGYGEDEFSPKPKRLRNGVTKEPDYMILSKNIRKAETPIPDANPETPAET
jgi:ribosomal protein S18 acetylase RimI-like enzyme